MKNPIIGSFVIVAALLFAPQFVQAQGAITYISNLGYTSGGSSPIGSDSWLAAGFSTGTNPGGYTLNSIQLSMTDATGNPSGFTVMIYKLAAGAIVYESPGSLLTTLNGSSDPETAGIYTYTPASSLTLLPAVYYIVLTAGTTVATGAYEWSSTPSTAYNPVDGWFEAIGPAGNQSQSSDGSSWDSGAATAHDWRLAINATAIPEPSPVSLLFLGIGILFYVRRRK
jgi:hypothetical protein